MGMFLSGYGDATYDHEDYPGQVLDDGSVTGTHSDETEPRMVGAVVAACDCGWTGTTRYPTREEFDEAAEELALAEWEHTHARPVLAQAQHNDVYRLQVRLRRLATAELTPVAGAPRPLADRLAGVVEALEQLTALARRLREQAQQQTQQGGADAAQVTR